MCESLGAGDAGRAGGAPGLRDGQQLRPRRPVRADDGGRAGQVEREGKVDASPSPLPNRHGRLGTTVREFSMGEHRRG